jgi:hypothetical protein
VARKALHATFLKKAPHVGKSSGYSMAANGANDTRQKSLDGPVEDRRARTEVKDRSLAAHPKRHTSNCAHGHEVFIGVG